MKLPPENINPRNLRAMGQGLPDDYLGFSIIETPSAEKNELPKPEGFWSRLRRFFSQK